MRRRRARRTSICKRRPMNCPETSRSASTCPAGALANDAQCRKRDDHATSTRRHSPRPAHSFRPARRTRTFARSACAKPDTLSVRAGRTSRKVRHTPNTSVQNFGPLETSASHTPAYTNCPPMHRTLAARLPNRTSDNCVKAHTISCPYHLCSNLWSELVQCVISDRRSVDTSPTPNESCPIAPLGELILDMHSGNAAVSSRPDRRQ
jgi:hypothetical protein